MTQPVQIHFLDGAGEPLPVAPVRFGAAQLREQPDVCLGLLRSHVGAARPGAEVRLRYAGGDLDEDAAADAVTAALQDLTLDGTHVLPVQVSFAEDEAPAAEEEAPPPAAFAWEDPLPGPAMLKLALDRELAAHPAFAEVGEVVEVVLACGLPEPEELVPLLTTLQPDRFPTVAAKVSAAAARLDPELGLLLGEFGSAGASHHSWQQLLALLARARTVLGAFLAAPTAARAEQVAGLAAAALRAYEAAEASWDEVHLHVTCDRCDCSPIVGARFKSTAVDDYDLCASCHAAHGTGHGHPFRRVRTNVQCQVVGMYIGDRQLHPAVVCDGCDMAPLQGPRHKCRDLPDFDFCAGCHAAWREEPAKFPQVPADARFDVVGAQKEEDEAAKEEDLSLESEEEKEELSGAECSPGHGRKRLLQRAAGLRRKRARLAAKRETVTAKAEKRVEQKEKSTRADIAKQVAKLARLEMKLAEIHASEAKRVAEAVEALDEQDAELARVLARVEAALEAPEPQSPEKVCLGFSPLQTVYNSDPDEDGEVQRVPCCATPGCGYLQNTSDEYKRKKPPAHHAFCCSLCKSSGGKRHGAFCQQQPKPEEIEPRPHQLEAAAALRAAVGEGALVQMATGMGKSDTIALVAKQMEKEGAVVHVATGMGKADTMALAAKQAEKEEPCTPRSEESWEDAAMSVDSWEKPSAKAQAYVLGAQLFAGGAALEDFVDGAVGGSNPEEYEAIRTQYGLQEIVDLGVPRLDGKADLRATVYIQNDGREAWEEGTVLRCVAGASRGVDALPLRAEADEVVEVSLDFDSTAPGQSYWALTRPCGEPFGVMLILTLP